MTNYIRHQLFFGVIIIFASFMFINAFDSVEFEPYRPSDSYKCGQFIETSVNDPAMRLFYQLNNQFIQLLSKPFPHEQLVSKDALSNVNAVEQSVRDKYIEWLDFELYWVIFCASIISLAVIFPLAYITYRCICCCCCCRGNTEKPVERPYDNCQRIFLDIIISIFIIVNIFAAVILLISTQYAQYGVEELPTRLHFCVNDLSVYKFENNERIRKLLRDDFQTLNTTFVKNIESVGVEVVTRFKRASKASIIDDLLANLTRGNSVQNELVNVRIDLKETQENKQILASKLYKLRESEQNLRKCASSGSPQRLKAAASSVAAPQQGNIGEGDPARVCQTVLHLIQPLIDNDEFNRNSNTSDLTSVLIPEHLLEKLVEINSLHIDDMFSQIINMLKSLETEIQKLVNRNIDDIKNRLHSLDDTLFRLYENISAGIRNFNVKQFEELIDPLMESRESFKKPQLYSWIAMLIITGIFMFIALAFLLGLFYGCCGRRPSLYNDDCCVRTTGSRFYGCGTWLSLICMTIFGITTAVLIFVGANVSHLVCHPLEDPLSRPDMISFLDRLIDSYDLRNSHFSFLGTNRHPIDIIRGCQSGKTFYTIFDLDRKFKLASGDGFIDELTDFGSTMKSWSLGRLFKPERIEFNEGLKQLLERLSNIVVDKIDEGNIQKFDSSKEHFEVESTLHQLNKILESEKLSIGPVISDVKFIVEYLESLKADARDVLIKIDSTTHKLAHLRSEINTLAQFTASLSPTELTKNVSDFYGLYNSPAVGELLNEAANSVIDDLIFILKQYVDYISKSVQNDISSCEPIRKIVHDTRAAMCDYTLDPINGVAMAMAVSLLLLIPIIMIATRLTGLYARIDPLHTYLHERTETNFATDNYYVGPNTRMLKADQYNDHNENNHFINGYSNGSIFNGSNNYGYQDFYASNDGYRNGY